MNSTTLRQKNWYSWIPAILVSAGLAQDTGVVTGFVGFSGSFPPQTSITVSIDQNVCGHRIPGEEFVVDPETRGLANVVVFWERPSGEHAAVQGSSVITVSQTNCRYEPHVQVGPTGATIEIMNNDGILHNIHVYDSEGETLFNIAQPVFKKKLERKLNSQDKVIRFRCDVHKWMNGYILQLDNAAYAITDSKGLFRLDGVHTGTQDINFWHEGLGKAVRTVNVNPQELTVLDLVIEPNE